DPLGHLTTYTRDSAGYVRAEIRQGPVGLLTTTYTYNTTSPYYTLTSTTDPLNHTTTYTYYPSSPLLHTVEDALHQLTTYTLTANGLLESVTNPRGFLTSYGYDTYNRTTTLVEAKGTVDERTTTMLYDVVTGNLLSQTTGIPSGSSTLAPQII